MNCCLSYCQHWLSEILTVLAKSALDLQNESLLINGINSSIFEETLSLSGSEVLLFNGILSPYLSKYVSSVLQLQMGQKQTSQGVFLSSVLCLSLSFFMKGPEIHILASLSKRLSFDHVHLVHPAAAVTGCSVPLTALTVSQCLRPWEPWRNTLIASELWNIPKVLFPASAKKVLQQECEPFSERSLVPKPSLAVNPQLCYGGAPYRLLNCLAQSCLRHTEHSIRKKTTTPTNNNNNGMVLAGMCPTI